MRAILIAALIASLTPAAALAQAKVYTTAETPIGALLDDPAAKAVLEKHMPQLVEGGGAERARSVTLKALQDYAPTMFTAKVLADVDADLAKIPAKK